MPLFLAEGGNIVNVTPCGTESGAEPILDRHGEVVVKFLDVETFANAGNWKVECEYKGCTDAFVAH